MLKSPLDPRILHYLAYPVRGGAEEHALSLVTSLRNLGMTPILVAPSALLRAMETELRTAKVRGVAVEPYSPLNALGLRRMVRLFRSLKPDVVHCHLFDATLRAGLPARIAGVPVVIETCHGPERWRMEKRLKGTFFLDRQISVLVDRYIAVSHAAARHLCEIKKIPAGKVTVIHNGRDLARFKPATDAEREAARVELGLAKDDRMVLVYGRLDHQKGHTFFLRALALLDARWPRVVALCAGEGPLRDELISCAAALGIANRVRFIGYRTDPERLLAASDIVVLPSLYEGLPLVAIEALATARPLVATAVDGTPEVVVEGRTGLLVPPGDGDALANAIQRLLEEPALGQRLARAGRAFVEQNFDVRTQVENTAALYRRVLAEASRAWPSAERSAQLAQSGRW